jgi:gluconolactonase
VTGVEVLASGYQLAEAPRVAADGSIFHTDVLGGGVYRWSGGAVDVVVPKRRAVGGLALHADGGVVVSGRDLTHVAPDGTNRLVFALPDGVTGFNDCCALPTGAVLVGALRWLPFAGGEPERVPGEFWHVGAHDEPCIDVPDITWPNGCGVDVERRRTYANDYAHGRVWVRDVDGLRVFAELPGGEADGLAVDDEGGVWVATARGNSLVRLAPDDGSVVDELRFDEPVTSVAFDGGAAMIVTTFSSLLRLEAKVPGARHQLATV